MSDYYLLTASVILFITGLYMASRKRHSPAGKLSVLALVCLYLLVMVLYFVSDYFTGKGFNESVLYHLYAGVQGAGFREYTNIILAAFLFLGVGIAGTYFFVLTGKPADSSRRTAINTVTLYLLILAAVILNPVSIYLVDSLSAEQKSDFYNYYRTPEITKRPGEKRNVVFIYAEGLERTYFDEAIFPGLIKKLRTLESGSTYFTSLAQPWGTGWTMGGMVASQCGIPLATPSHGNSMFGMDHFLDNAVCIGDLLADEGYRLSYLGGASIKFAGKGKFYATHGFTDIKGRESLSHLLPDRNYMNNWGLRDDSLFDIAFRQFEKLSADDRAFGLFMLTLGTHPPDGSLSKRCSNITYRDGNNPILNAVACSDYLIGNFVDKILESDYADNTIIVIASDHLSMRNTAYELLKTADRKNMLMIIDPGDRTAREVSREGSILDVGPVVLNTLGYRASVGLGRDLLEGKTSLYEALPNTDQSLKGWKSSLLDFWNFPNISKGLEINAAQNRVKINNREFRIPILVEFDAQLGTSMKFQSDSSDLEKKLIDHVRELGMNDAFIWIDFCRTMTSDKHATGICTVLGKLGAKEIARFKTKGRAKISIHDLRRIILLNTNEGYFNSNRKRFLNMRATN